MSEKAKRTLSTHGIKTTADIDALRNDERSEHYCKSRFSILKSFVGFDAAMWILNDMAIIECCK